MILLALLACGNSGIDMFGPVQVSRLDSTAMEEGSVEILQLDGARFDRSQVVDGRVQVRAPASASIFAVVRPTGGVATSFSVATGPDDFRVPDGALHGTTISEVRALETQFDGCPALAGAGLVYGEIRFDNITYEDTDVLQVAPTGWVERVGDDESEGCYLEHLEDDDVSAEDLVYDPDQTTVGPSGRFLIGFPEGVHELSVLYSVGDDTLRVDYPLAIVQDGVSPWFPALVHFPL